MVHFALHDAVSHDFLKQKPANRQDCVYACVSCMTCWTSLCAIFSHRWRNRTQSSIL